MIGSGNDWPVSDARRSILIGTATGHANGPHYASNQIGLVFCSALIIGDFWLLFTGHYRLFCIFGAQTNIQSHPTHNYYNLPCRSQTIHQFPTEQRLIRAFIFYRQFDYFQTTIFTSITTDIFFTSGIRGILFISRIFFWEN